MNIVMLYSMKKVTYTVLIFLIMLLLSIGATIIYGYLS